MAKFDDLLSGLHNGTAKLADSREDDNGIIIINDKRQFQPSVDFDTTIAYEGDINSQIVTFKLPRYHDKHDLSGCQFKQVRWKNLGSGMENTSDLKIDGEPTTDNFYLTWEVPSEACTAAGRLEISISCYDKTTDTSYIAYSWNTALYTGLSIGASIATVGHTFPAKSDILIIDKETKNIVAPSGYNSTICVLGDVGTVHVYFLVNRFLGSDGSFDILGEGIEPAMYIIANNERRKDTSCLELKTYTEELEDRSREGLVFIDWAVPSELTSGALNANDFEIAIEFAKVIRTENESIVEKRWLSNPYNGLKIGKSILQSIVTPSGDATEEYVYKLIDKYFEVHDITWEA